MTRRYFFVRRRGELVHGTAPRKEGTLVVGDRVSYGMTDYGEIVLRKVLPRRSELIRSFGMKRKQLSANLDHLFVLTADGALFQPSAVDRALAAAADASIDTTVIVNKVDLLEGQSSAAETVYRKAGLRVLTMSAKYGLGIADLRRYLADCEGECVAFAGVSGVGKSTLLNALDPSAERHTAEVSEKSRSGRQTTTQAFGWYVHLDGGREVCVIDLPGIQNYGIGHLEKREVRLFFPEFAAPAEECEYVDCLHVSEPDCAVRRAVEAGEVATTRYESYVEILEEIERSRPY